MIFEQDTFYGLENGFSHCKHDGMDGEDLMGFDAGFDGGSLVCNDTNALKFALRFPRP